MSLCSLSPRPWSGRPLAQMAFSFTNRGGRKGETVEGHALGNSSEVTGAGSYGVSTHRVPPRAPLGVHCIVQGLGTLPSLLGGPGVFSTSALQRETRRDSLGSPLAVVELCVPGEVFCFPRTPEVVTAPVQPQSRAVSPFVSGPLSASPAGGLCVHRGWARRPACVWGGGGGGKVGPRRDTEY